MPKVTVSVRIDEAIESRLPTAKKERASFLRNAISSAIDGRQVPTPDELDELRALLKEFRPAARNLNQLVHSIHHARKQGQPLDVPEKLVRLIEDLAIMGRRGDQVLGTWEGRTRLKVGGV